MNQIAEFENLLQLLAKSFHTSGPSHLGELDITFQQFMVMRFIYQKDCPKMTDLADDLKVTMGNVTTMIDRLIKQNYLIRKDDPEDRRIVRVCLTNKGKDLIKKAAEVRKKHMEIVLNKLSKEDRNSLFRIMEKLAQAIQKDREETKK